MTLAEFTAVVDKRVAWKILFRMAVLIVGGFMTLLSIAITPILWVYGNVNGNQKDVARLEFQVTGLTQTVGNLQLTVAGVTSEVKATRNDQARDLADIKALLQQRTAPLPARTANVPTRRTQ